MVTTPADPAPDGATARRLWEIYEPLHDVVYFTPECRAAADDLGLRGFWMGYFALRAAPLGAVGPGAVTAAFHGFHRDRVARALPDAWTFTTPERAVAARERGSVAALQRLAGQAAAAVDLGRAADLAWDAVAGADCAGRVLAGANLDLPRSSDPLTAVWQACTTLREHRGDGHVAVLLARGIGPLEAHLVKTASGESDPDRMRLARRWPDEEWSAAVASLQRRGWLDDAGSLTDAGSGEHAEVERLTDAAATGPWEALGAEGTEELAALLGPLTGAVVRSGEIPAGNPVGLTLGP
ncbi:hypothetical protein EV383_3991 [Pseudonocardia sediminis]|uniref:SalK n=1 Tax=Pseudonocardia sediminis TaxID=1397368 RepID=A0A4Q7V0X8_PSEST|nr:hypothetical protein [Pseudonocardia sediminis]RZT87084.1 hypothetical protein EV383_3991 [Pseudonocardia sediminis]